MNFLVGKKEENPKKKKKKKIGSSSSSSSSFADSENLKLKWSFRKSSTNNNPLLTHKLSKSVDSINTIEAMKQVAMAEQRKPPSDVQNAAATTIQSSYRSHLVTDLFVCPIFRSSVLYLSVYVELPFFILVSILFPFSLLG